MQKNGEPTPSGNGKWQGEKGTNQMKPSTSGRTRAATLLAVTLIPAFTLALRAQPQTTQDEIAAWQPLAPDAIPKSGTFWSLRATLSGALTPPLPIDLYTTNVAVYFLGAPGQFLVDDTSATDADLQPQTLTSPDTLAATPLLPGDGTTSDGTTTGQSDSPLSAYSFPSNSLWLEIAAVTNGVASLVLHGTVADVNYETLSKEALSNSAWVSEGPVLGLQDSTPTAITVGTRTNALFLWARSWADADGNGIFDWWEIQYLGTNGVDPYSSLAGDGWTAIYKYEHGLNPLQFYTPPPPQNVVAKLDWTGTNVVITWATGGGPVSGYGVWDDKGYAWAQVDASTFTCTLNPRYQFIGDLRAEPGYYVGANFTGGGSAVSQRVTVSNPAFDLQAALVRGPAGQVWLTMVSPPPDLSRIHLFWPSILSNGVASTDVYATNLVNGAVPVPVSQLTGLHPEGAVWVQAVGTNGDFGAWSALLLQVAPEEVPEGTTPPYQSIDARSNVLENLRFLLRSATVSLPFSYASGLKIALAQPPLAPDAGQVWFPEAYYARPSSPSSYEYYGFHTFSSNLNYAVMEEMRPLREHFLWRNYVLNAADVDTNGVWTTGADYDTLGQIRVLDGPKHQYSGCGAEIPLPLAFTAADANWLYYRWIFFYWDLPATAEVGVWFDANGYAFLGVNVLNCYGLALASLYLGSEHLFQPGAAVTGFYDDYFPKFAAPTLQTVDYYFVSQTPYFQGRAPRPPLPGSPDFTVTNTSPPLITAVGQPLTVAAWAKMQIANGYPNKFGYLEQYFDRAFLLDPSGNVTTNQTALVSPYGEFFPTEPGQIALVTMPDIETGQRGTGVVNVIKLQLDVNHDGVMDLSSAGPDNTSPTRPFVFWINDDWDVSGRDVNPANAPRAHDYSDSIIGTARDLEDLARLWIVGLPALPSSGGYSVTLGWRNVTGDPAIRLFRAYETNGGIGYLTNFTIGAAQALHSWDPFNEPGYGDAVDMIAISQSLPLTFPADFFGVQGTNSHFLFEGAGIGSGELVLTVLRGTNVLAQTSTWLDIRNIKTMYEQVLIDNVSDDTPNSLTSTNKPELTLPPDSSEARQLIVFVHGWRMGVWDHYNFSETMFKRLYWQGYQGRFATVRWRTLSHDDYALPLADLTSYNKSEFRAHQSGVGLANYFNWLRGRFPDYTIGVCSHSMGGIVMMQALKAELAAGRQDIDNYVLMQVAVPAHCYDTTLPNYPPFAAAESQVGPTPDTYRGYPGAINGALRGRIVNFFNTNDFALATGTLPLLGAVSWEANEASYKPDSGYYVTNGTNAWKLIPNRLLTDAREIMSFVARPRSKAVGAQPDVGGTLYTIGEIDLKASFGFDNKKEDHSAQFNWNIQNLWPFYRTLITSLLPPQ